MRKAREERIISAALRCYSSRWRRRHGDDARLLVETLLENGVTWWSIAFNFLGGAARERASQRPSRRVGTALTAVIVGIVAVPLALFASLAPASASSANVEILISNPHHAARQLEAAFASHHFKVTVTERTVPTRLIGSILSVNIMEGSNASARVISELHGQCVIGAAKCVNGLVLPRHFTGVALVMIGRAATPKHIRAG